MKVFLSTAVLSAIACSPYCCQASDEAEQRQRRDELTQPDGFGLDANTPLQVPENQQIEDEWDHVPFESRIVGGSVANAENYPFSVNLGGCGGSLIHEDIVLTAAHCKPLYPETARIGGSTKNSGVRAQIVGTGTRHPSYNSRGQDYDFMVYKLSSPATGLTPVQLNTDSDTPSNQETLTVIGFGSTFEGGPGSFNLREVDIKNVPYSNCNSAYRGQIEDDIMFCAGVEGGGQDSCQGDSGGPILDQNGVQVGVTSWGNGCAQRGFPGVYARVSAVSDWLEEQICEMSDNPPASCRGSTNSPPIDSPTASPTRQRINGVGNGGDNGGGNGGNGGTGNNDNGNNGNGNNDSDMIQPKGISLRVDVTYDQYPQESAWVLYDDETKEELHWTDYGDVTTAGLRSMTFPDLAAGKYVFLLLDSAWDGVCCEYGLGGVTIFEVFPQDSGRDDEPVWKNDGRFLNAVGSTFYVVDEEDRRGLRVSDEKVNLGDSPYAP